MEEIDYPILDVGDVAYIFKGGYGFEYENEKLYCIIEEYSETGYFGCPGYLVSKYEHDLVDHDYDNDWVGVDSFGESPLVLFNINDEHTVDEDDTVVAKGSKQDVDKALGVTRDEYSLDHYDLYYTLTEKDIAAGRIKVDAYWVAKQWQTGGRDDSGALWHSLKTIARFGEKNDKAREIKALYNQAIALARIYDVEL